MADENSVQISPPSGADRLTTADIIEQLAHFDGPPEQFLINLLAVQCHVAGAAGGAILRPAIEDRSGQPAEGQEAGPEQAQEQVEVLAIFPPLVSGAVAPVWLARAVESAGQVFATGRVVVRALRAPDELYGQPSRQHLVMLPIRGAGAVRGLAAFLVEARDASAVAAARERLELTVSLLSLYEMRLTLQRRQLDLRRLRTAMEALAAVDEQDRFAATAMTLCNELATRWQADRVSLGFLRGRYVKLQALSHTEKFSRKMKVVQDIEAAMEECLDQDVEIVHPPPAGAGFVGRATGELCKRHGPTAIVSLPLRRNGEAIAVLTVERTIDRPFNLEELETLRLTCDLCTPRVALLREHDRWIGAKAASTLRRGLGGLVGPRHTWAKVGAVLVLAGLLFITLAKGHYRAEAPFVLEATQRQAVVAPFDGYLKSVSAVRPGDPVGKDDELAVLHTWQLELQLADAVAQQASYQTQADLARRDGETAKQQIAEAEARRVAARIDLLRQRVSQARICSPIDGCLLSGDWSQAIGKPVRTGEVLFEVAPLGALWAEWSLPEEQAAGMAPGQPGRLSFPGGPGLPNRLVGFIVEQVYPIIETGQQERGRKVRVRLTETPPWLSPAVEGPASIADGPQIRATVLGSLWAQLSVPEDQIADVRPGQTGELAAASYPDRRVGFVVEQVNPVAEVIEQHNVFKVRVRLDHNPSWMRPGMEGVAKISLGRKSYVWLWTRRLLNWLRMKLWLDV